MDVRRSFRGMGIAVAAAAAVLVGASRAAAQAAPDEGTLLAELRQIQQQLAEIERRVITETPELRERGRQLEARVIAAMTEADPETPTHLARLEAMPAEVQAAEERNDRSRLEELAGEARGIRERLDRAQAAALAREEVASEVSSYQAEVLRKMVEVEPRTEQLLARARELMETLRPRG